MDLLYIIILLYFTVHNQQLLPLRILITDHVSMHEVSTEQQTRETNTQQAQYYFGLICMSQG